MFSKLIQWSKQEFSHLPWRKDRSLFRTLVSEIMLQQTTVPTVLNHFEAFLKRFPDLQSLASASEEEVCIYWKGLGYYRRARSLRKACGEILEKYGGKIPKDYSKLIDISGIGAYTANALCAIGSNVKSLPLDANLERVLSRIFLVEGLKGAPLQRKLYSLFERGKILEDMQDWGPRQLSEALMDLGRTFCRAQKASCETCPVSFSCKAYREDRVESFLYAQKEKLILKKKMHSLSLLRIVVKKGNEILVYQKTPGEWLEGQLELPTFIIESSDPVLIQYPELPEKMTLDLESFKSFSTSITKYKIVNYLWEITEKEFKKVFRGFPYKVFFRSFENGQNRQINFATSVLKAMKSIQEIKGKGEKRKTEKRRKPDSVLDYHSSSGDVTITIQHSTRQHRRGAP